jgi:hypothetical protein
MKISKFRKGGKANLSQRLIGAAAVGAGAVVGTAAGAKMSTKMNPNLVGPVLLALGTAGEVLLSDETARAACKGVIASGTIRMAGQLAKDKAGDTFGLRHFPARTTTPTSGIGQSYADMMAQQAEDAFSGADDEMFDGADDEVFDGADDDLDGADDYDM